MIISLIVWYSPWFSAQNSVTSNYRTPAWNFPLCFVSRQHGFNSFPTLLGRLVNIMTCISRNFYQMGAEVFMFFLFFRTDFYLHMRHDKDTMGFPPGVAKKIVLAVSICIYSVVMAENTGNSGKIIYGLCIYINVVYTGIILCMRPANERRYRVTSLSLAGCIQKMIHCRLHPRCFWKFGWILINGFNSGPVLPYGVIELFKSIQHWFKQWLASWWRQNFTRSSADFSTEVLWHSALINIVINA